MSKSDNRPPASRPAKISYKKPRIERVHALSALMGQQISPGPKSP